MLGRGSTTRRVGGVLSSVVAAPLTSVTVPLAGYLGVLSIVGTVAGRRAARPVPATGAPTTHFAVLVPAHDEEGVVGRSVASMVAQDYPAESFSVHVVADNCTDATAAEAREAGAVVHERVALDDRGKGAALNWLRAEVLAADEAVDAFV